MYPAYYVHRDPSDDSRIEREVDETTLARWEAAQAAYFQARQEIRNLLDPPCPECGHPGSRHQEWSATWDYWGCLSRSQEGPTCGCQHGIPASRHP